MWTSFYASDTDKNIIPNITNLHIKNPKDGYEIEDLFYKNDNFQLQNCGLKDPPVQYFQNLNMIRKIIQKFVISFDRLKGFKNDS